MNAYVVCNEKHKVLTIMPAGSPAQLLVGFMITTVVPAELKSAKSNGCREEPKRLREFAADGNERQSTGGLTNIAHCPLSIASHHSILT